ncbi:MAG: glycosyltransferase family 39 protein [Cyanobacteriota bacterium]|nr:glycosyltransferase family 39 protein [Cyanobacteriota bacterium]
MGLGLLWLLTTIADRTWLALDPALPAWDQADYLNSAVDHGRALGLLGGAWPGWRGLLDLSPKIPPLASLVNGTVIALAGEGADRASWALALWHGLLLVAVAGWGRQLGGAGTGLLAAAMVALMPALSGLRVDFTLDLPLTATTTLALGCLWRWQRPAPHGGRWPQLLAAALAMAAALLVKQSALPILLGPGLWALAQALGGRRRRQALAGILIVVAALAPWLHHNWITAISGTSRAVVEAGAAEGDPPPLSLASLLWYPRRLFQQLGLALLVPLQVEVSAMALGATTAGRVTGLAPGSRGGAGASQGWTWLAGATLVGGLLLSLSPNKDERYSAPLLPLLALLLAHQWWRLGPPLARRLGRRPAAGLLAAGLAAAGLATGLERRRALAAAAPRPAPAICERLRAAVGQAPTTVVVLPSTADLNQHTLTSLCRQRGGRSVGRQPFSGEPDAAALIGRRATWLVLADGDQGTDRDDAAALSRRLWRDPRFSPVGRWPWSAGRHVELRRRIAAAGPGEPFDPRFVVLARGLEQGPTGLAPVFAAIGPEHQLDGQRLYQGRVAAWARARLARRADDRDALWSLALLTSLRNRPAEAAHWYARLERLEPSSPWPSTYRAVVLLAGGQPWPAAAAAREAERRRPDPLVRGLADLTGALGGDLQRLGRLPRSLPDAIRHTAASLSPTRP